MKKKLLHTFLILTACICAPLHAYPTHAYLTDEDPPFFSDERYIETAEQDVELIPVNNGHVELYETE